jgi:hypothetical protein
MKKSLYWNAFLRLILEATLDLAISVLYNTEIWWQVYKRNSNAKEGDPLYPDWYIPDLIFFWMNLTTTVGGLLILAFLPSFIFCYFLCKFKVWEEEDFEESVGSVLEGLRKDTRTAVFYPVFFMFRRTVFAVQAIYFGDQFSFQINLQIILTMVQICFLLNFKPFDNPLMQRLEVMNETFTLVLMYIVVTFNKLWVDSEHARDVMGYTLIGLIFTNIFINFFFLFRTIYHGYEEKVFRRREKASKCAICFFRPFSEKIKKSEKLRKERIRRWEMRKMMW